MLIEPASKVSVPDDEVTRTRSNVPPNANTPVAYVIILSVDPKTAVAVQVFPVNKVKVTDPVQAVEDVKEAARIIPDVVVLTAAEDAVYIYPHVDEYPEVVTEPDPI